MARTQEQRKAETRGRLLDAAASLIALEGFDAVSVDAISDAADRTSGSVYAHFGGKQGLLLAVVEEFQDHLAAVVSAEFVTHANLAGRLLSLWRNVDAHPSAGGTSWFLLEMELWLRSQRDEDVASPLALRYRQVYDLMRPEFARWVAEFDLRPAVTPDDLPQAVFGMLAGLQMQRLLNPDLVTDELAQSVLLALFGAS